MKKTLIALLLVVAMVITVSVFAASAETTNPFENKTGVVNAPCQYCSPSADVEWKPLSTSLTAAITTGHWYLVGETNQSAHTAITSGTLCLELNGFNYNRTTSGHPFAVNGTGAVMNIFDSSAEESGKIQIALATGNCNVLQLTGGTINQYGGTLDTPYNTTATSGNGSCLRMFSGNYNMYGGAMHGKCLHSGGAVHQAAGTFTMHNGTITGQSAAYGGAVCMSGGTFVMKNGTIEDSFGSHGGAFYVSGTNTKLTVENGIIEDCYGTNRAGGIMVTGTTASLEFKGGTLRNCFIKNGSGTEFGGNIYLEYAKGTISGGIIENGGIAAAGMTVTADTEHDGGNICLRGNGAGLTISGDAIIRNGKGLIGGNIYTQVGAITMTGGTISGGNATTGGSIYLGPNQNLTVTGGKITGGVATGNGGNIYTEGGNTITIDAAEGKTVEISKGKAGQGGNIRNYKSTVNITGPNVTISGGTGVGPDIRTVGVKDATSGAITYATVNLTDVTMLGSGVHGTTISVGPKSQINLAGNTQIDRIQFEGEANVGVASNAQVLIKESFTGTAFVGWSDIAGYSTIAAGQTAHHSLWQETGYKGTGTVYGLDGTTSSKILADAGDATGTDSKFVVASFAGIKVDENGKEVVTPMATASGADQYDYIRPYFDTPITLECDTTLDLNNSTVHVTTGNYKLNLIEKRTNNFEDAGDVLNGTGYAEKSFVTVDNEANVNTVVREKASGNQYIVVPTGTTNEGLTKFTAHRVQVDIDSVSLKPSTAGIYYTTNMDTTPFASAFAKSYGVVLSLVDMPGADFLTDDSNEDGKVDNIYTVNNIDPETIERVQIAGANSALLTGILNQDAPEGQNADWGAKPVHANAYVCFEINGQKVYVMADKTYTLSLKDIMDKINNDETLATNQNVIKLYDTWQDPMAVWGLDNIKTAWEASKATNA